ncbi:MAG: hypothetical protein RLZZ458_158 [Planctomycetota bacterium]
MKEGMNAKSYSMGLGRLFLGCADRGFLAGCLLLPFRLGFSVRLGAGLVRSPGIASPPRTARTWSCSVFSE